MIATEVAIGIPGKAVITVTVEATEEITEVYPNAHVNT